MKTRSPFRRFTPSSNDQPWTPMMTHTFFQRRRHVFGGWAILCRVVLLPAALAEQSFAQPIRIETIALSGDPIPRNDRFASQGDSSLLLMDGRNGQPFTTPPAIDSRGRVVFAVTGRAENATTDSRHLLHSETNPLSPLTSIYDGGFISNRSLQPEFRDLVVSSSGFAAFEAIAPSGEREDFLSSGFSLFVGALGTSFAFVEAENLPFSGDTASIEMTIGPIAINNPGSDPHVFFVGGADPIAATCEGCESLPDLVHGVFVTSFSPLTERPARTDFARRNGRGAPRVGRNFGFFGSGVINGTGEAAFLAQLDVLDELDPRSTTINSIWKYSKDDGLGLTLIAAKGDPAPGLPPGTEFTEFGEIAISPGGVVAFTANGGIWKGTGLLDPVLVAGAGTTSTLRLNSSGCTERFSAGINARLSKNLAFTEAGDLLFQTSFGQGGSIIVSGIFKATIDGAILGVVTTEPRSRTGEDIGDLPPGTLVPDVGPERPFTIINFFAVNAQGRIAFSATYDDPGCGEGMPSGIRGLWAQTESGRLVLVAEPGCTIETRDGDKTVSRVDFLTGPGNTSGLSTCFDDDFRLAFFAEFTDGTSGIFRAVVDEGPFGILLDGDDIRDCGDTGSTGGAGDGGNDVGIGSTGESPEIIQSICGADETAVPAMLLGLLVLRMAQPTRRRGHR